MWLRKCLLTLALLTFTFCVGAHGETLRLWHKEESAQSRRTLEELATLFGQQHGALVEMTRLDPTDLAPQLLKNALEGTLPDVAFVPADLVGLHAQLALSPVPMQTQSRHIKPNFLSTTRVDNEHYGAPILGGNHLLLYYNRRYVTTPADDWEELFSQHEQFRERGIKTIGMHYTEPFWFVNFIDAFGGNIDLSQRDAVEHDAVKRALQFYKQLGQRGLLDIDCDYSCPARRFYQGEYAYAINGDWALSDARSALGDDLGVAVLPRLDNHPMRTTFSSTALIFPGRSLEGPKRELLTELIAFFQSAEVQQHWYKAADRFPVREDTYAAFTAEASGPRKAALQQLEQAIMMPNHQAMAVIWQGLRKGLTRYLNGSIDVNNVAQVMRKYIEYQSGRNQKD